VRVKSEIRNPKSEEVVLRPAHEPGRLLGIRTSDFFRQSGFGIRIFVLSALFCLQNSALACSVCFGGDSKLTEGMHAGVLVLLLIVVAVLGGFAAFFIFLARKAAATAALEANSTESKA